ncbi:MAG: hypothetical protein QOD65_2115, partial [Gaiellales bacterium]|nr:hypothetical protein [Gaiellales bacterium]
WNYAVDRTNPAAPVYLGEPEDTSAWEDQNNLPEYAGHPSAYPGDTFRKLRNEKVARPVIRFDPVNGRIAFPLMRTHVGKRPPFSPNGHSGAPWLGETADAAPAGAGPAPWADRTDGLCPSDATIRRFNIVALDGLHLQLTRAGAVDPNGKVFVLAHDVDDVLAGRKPIEPLAIRANIGDCIAVTLTSLMHDSNDFSGFSKANIHIHHVQFDTQASDGVVTGMSYEQTIRPYMSEDPQLVQASAAGATTLTLSSVAKFQPGEWIAAGLGTESIEVRQIATINAAAKRLTLTKALANAHASGQYAGVEFVQYRWYPDVQLDNVFWHTHIDGIHDWGHGMVGQLIIEPRGSTYHDPATGAQVDSGTIVDIHTNPTADDPSTHLAPGLLDGSFRELALWTIDQNPTIDSTLNLRAEPWADRLVNNGDPSLLFSSYTHGDPFTPLPRAYAGDPFVIRTINVSDGVDTLHIDGGRFVAENRLPDPDHPMERAGQPIDTIHYGVSERYSQIAKGGAGGPLATPGDYLYMNSIARRFRQGAWGIIRVLAGLTPTLKPLPDRTVPVAGSPLPAKTGGRPPEPGDTGNPCPVLAPTRTFDISAVDVPSSAFGNQLRAAFVPTNVATLVEKKTLVPEPLVLHVAAGECVTVHFTNRRTVRASFHATGLLEKSAGGGTAFGSASSGIDVGFGPEQTVAPNGSRDYRLYADTAKLGATTISDFGGRTVVAQNGTVATNVDTGPIGLYGAIVVGPAGATFTDPVYGGQTSLGSQVDVHVPGAAAYRDFTLMMQDVDDAIGQAHMPYPTDVKGITTTNYKSGRRTVNDVDASYAGDPGTPLLRAYRGDPMQVHVLGTPGSEQMHVFSLGGLSWPLDPFIAGAVKVQARAFGPWESLEIKVSGGAGGGSTVGDLFYGDLRRPFTAAGMWGLQRVISSAGCPIKPLDGRTCLGGTASLLARPVLATASDTGTSHIDNVTRDAMPAFTGHVAANAGVRLLVDGAVVSNGTAGSDGSWTLGSTALTDGTHFVTYAQNVGGTGWSEPSDPLTIRIDTVGPNAFFTSAPAGPVTNASPVFEFGPQGAGAAFECSLGTVTDTFAACTSPKAYTALPDATYTFKVRATDIAGNTGIVVSSTFTLTTTPTP